MAKSDKNHIVISTKSLFGAVVATIGILSGMGVVHTTFIMPSVIEEARDMSEKLIESHSRYPHPASVSRVEFEGLKQSLGEFRADTKVALIRIERRLETILTRN